MTHGREEAGFVPRRCGEVRSGRLRGGLAVLGVAALLAGCGGGGRADSSPRTADEMDDTPGGSVQSTSPDSGSLGTEGGGTTSGSGGSGTGGSGGTGSGADDSNSGTGGSGTGSGGGGGSGGSGSGDGGGGG